VTIRSATPVAIIIASQLDQVPKFAVDRMLARLARWLRLLGADTIYDASISGSALLAQAREQGRVMITRDKRLRTAPGVIFLSGNNFRDQLREVLTRCPFDTRAHPFTRCSRCNAVLFAVDREVVRRRVPQFVYASHDRFAECPGCARIYWGATHPQRMLDELSSMGL
jgi:uncharacterized protein with PIN domain